MTDLSLVLEDELWEELKKRYDACVLVTLKTLDGKRESSQVSWHGGKFVCMGLAEVIIERIKDVYWKDCGELLDETS